MIRIPFPDLDRILTFDGEVLEVFHGDTSIRIHIGHIKGIQVKTDRKGKQILHVETIVGEIPYMSFPESRQAKVNELVIGVQNAMATFRFE